MMVRTCAIISSSARLLLFPMFNELELLNIISVWADGDRNSDFKIPFSKCWIPQFLCQVNVKCVQWYGIRSISSSHALLSDFTVNQYCERFRWENDIPVPPIASTSVEIIVVPKSLIQKKPHNGEYAVNEVECLSEAYPGSSAFVLVLSWWYRTPLYLKETGDV